MNKALVQGQDKKISNMQIFMHSDLPDKVGGEKVFTQKRWKEWEELLQKIMALSNCSWHSVFVGLRVMYCNNPKSISAWCTDYGGPIKPFFHWNPELLGLGRQIGQINSGAFGVFLAELSVPVLILWVPSPCFPLFNHYFYKKQAFTYPHIPNIYFGLGFEFGPQRIRDLAFACLWSVLWMFFGQFCLRTLHFSKLIKLQNQSIFTHVNGYCLRSLF